MILLYALADNIIEKPDGIAISAMFILGIIVVSLISRITRTTELRVDRIEFDERARRFITDSIAHDGALNIIANRRQAGDAAEYAAKEARTARHEPGPRTAPTCSSWRSTSSTRRQFSDVLQVKGVEVDGYRILRASSPAAPNAIAAILLALRDATGVRPHCYFEWSEGSPLLHLLRYLILGRGDTPPVVREILRTAEPDPALRPGIHVGG